MDKTTINIGKDLHVPIKRGTTNAREYSSSALMQNEETGKSILGKKRRIYNT